MIAPMGQIKRKFMVYALISWSQATGDLDIDDYLAVLSIRRLSRYSSEIETDDVGGIVVA